MSREREVYKDLCQATTIIKSIIGIDWKVLASQDVIVAATIQNSGSLEYELSVFVFAWRFSMAHMESCRHAL